MTTTMDMPKSEILTSPLAPSPLVSDGEVGDGCRDIRAGHVGELGCASRHGVAPSQLFGWRRLANQGALTATQADEEVVRASEYRSLHNQIRELQRLLGKKTLESEILKEALEVATGSKNTC